MLNLFSQEKKRIIKMFNIFFFVSWKEKASFPRKDNLFLLVLNFEEKNVFLCLQ